MKRRIPLVVALFVVWTTVFLAESCVCADTQFSAQMDASQVVFNPSDTTATGAASFALNDEGTHLTYSVNFDGLDLEPIPENRTDPNDIIGMHIHLAVTDVTGPHILNIFGNPSHDDADLVVDYENESLTGVFDMSDASRDPVTGELLPQFFHSPRNLFPTGWMNWPPVNSTWPYTPSRPA